MRSTEGRDCYLTKSPQRLMELIGGFSKCHAVCSNNFEISSVTNLLVLHVTNAGKFQLNIVALGDCPRVPPLVTCKSCGVC